MIWKIARTELQSLFFSPIAWLILSIFAIQIGIVAVELFDNLVFSNSVGHTPHAVTRNVYTTLFSVAQSYLYLYIPLLTMNILSKDLNGGTIKLLQSSPLYNRQIILGKYLALMIFGLTLLGIVFLYILFGICTIPNPDIPHMLTGLLGLYLLLCAYAAIGLFVSSLTSYQVVAALGTLGILAILNYVGFVWQKIDFIRDLTYWLSIRNRAEAFILGLICSEEVLYFLIIIWMFLAWSILRLRNRVQRSRRAIRWGTYMGVLLLAVMLGYLSSRPQLMAYYDATHTKSQSLSSASQEIIAQMDGGLTITTYTNVLDRDFWNTLPQNLNQYKEQFKPYLRFKPETRMKFKYFYYPIETNDEWNPADTTLSPEERARRICDIYDFNFSKVIPPNEIGDYVDLSEEGYKSIRVLERGNGEKTFLRYYDYGGFRQDPEESQISAACKRLVRAPMVIGYLIGHGERTIQREADREHKRFTSDKTFRGSMINHGFNITEITLEKEIPEEIDILVIGDLRFPVTAEENARLERYITKGRDLFIMGEPGRQELLNPLIAPLGVKLLAGTLVRPSEAEFQPDLLQGFPTDEGIALWPTLEIVRKYEACIATPGCAGLIYTPTEGVTMVPLLATDTVGVWNKIAPANFMEDEIVFDPEAGDQAGIFTTAMALSRQVNNREQRIVLFGDADFISNGEHGTRRKGFPALNHIMPGLIYNWLSHGEYPIPIVNIPYKDNGFNVSENAFEFWKIVFQGIIPLLFAVTTIVIWVRRRGR